MRMVLRERRDPDAECIGVAVGAATAAIGFAWLHGLHLPVSSGVLRRVFHVPCPFCGGTRSVFLLMQGEWGAAFKTNPLVMLGAIAGVLWLAYATAAVLCRWRRVRVEDVSRREARMMRAGVVLLVAANWVYIGWAGI